MNEFIFSSLLPLKVNPRSAGLPPYGGMLSNQIHFYSMRKKEKAYKQHLIFRFYISDTQIVFY